MVLPKNGSSLNSSDIHSIYQSIQEFCVQVTYYRNRKSEESLVLLNRSALALTSTVPIKYYQPKQLEISKFFIDLHTVIGVLPIDSDVLWSCISLLQNCCQNLEARQAIIEEYRYVPLLTHILKNLQAKDKIQRILKLLQELTYSIRITWEEPYVIVLMELLVDMITTASDEDEESRAQIALSILINLCYKNLAVLFLFLRSVNISSFTQKIMKYGMLANKMLIILSEYLIHAPDEKELHIFLRSTFVSIIDCIKQWNVSQLRHIVDFLLDSESYQGLHQAMCHYGNFCDDIERILDQLEARSTMDDSNEDSTQHEGICMDLLFKLIRYVLELSDVLQQDGKENIISLESNVPRIFEYLCNWFESPICGRNAIQLLQALVNNSKKETIAARIARDPSYIIKLITISEATETAPAHTSAILQLLTLLLQQAKTEKLILTKITESYFDKIFAPLLVCSTELPGNASLASDETEKFIFCLLLLINFADIAKKAYFDKCCSMLQLKPIQIVLASATLTKNVIICDAVFQISKFEHFPHKQVAKHMSTLNTAVTRQQSIKTQTTETTYSMNALLKSHSYFFSKENEKQLVALMEAITNAQRSNQFNNISTSQIIELFNYKIEKSNCAENNMQKRLEDASNEITNLTQRVNLQNAELEKYHTMNFKLHIKQESLQDQCKDLQKQKDSLKRNLAELMKKSSLQSETLQISEKRLTVKTAENAALQKELHSVIQQLENKTVEVEKLHTMSKESAARIDLLKKSVSAYEIDIKEKTSLNEEKDRKIGKLLNSVEEQKEAKKKSDGVISVLETQLQEKNEQIRNYELELSETEEMRKTIMSLMESRKPKRKAV